MFTSLSIFVPPDYSSIASATTNSSGQNWTSSTRPSALSAPRSRRRWKPGRPPASSAPDSSALWTPSTWASHRWSTVSSRTCSCMPERIWPWSTSTSRGRSSRRSCVIKGSPSSGSWPTAAGSSACAWASPLWQVSFESLDLLQRSYFAVLCLNHYSVMQACDSLALEARNGFFWERIWWFLLLVKWGWGSAKLCSLAIIVYMYIALIPLSRRNMNNWTNKISVVKPGVFWKVF